MAKKKKGPGSRASTPAPKAGNEGKVSSIPPEAPDEAEPTSSADEPEESTPPSADPPAAKKPEPPPAPAHEDRPPGAAWALPLVRLDKAWTWFEARLLVVVLLSLIFAMVSWISLQGMALPLASESKAGMAFRVLFGIAVAGGLAQLATRKMPSGRRTSITTAAILVGAAVAPLWRSKGVEYSEHLFNWLQEGSSLTMFGGLRGLSTRITILLALIGASLAAGSGKHINIDVILRFLSPKIRRYVFVLSTVATFTVCISVAWGFFDFISIESFGAKNTATAGEKVDQVSHGASQDLFIWRKQLGLDFSAMFHVVGGGKWDDDGRMTGRRWNQIVNEEGYRDHFTKEECDQILAPPDALDESRIAMVVVPGGSPRGLMVAIMDLVWCWGLVTIGFRFLLRMLLVMSGHASSDPEPEEFEGVIPSEGEVDDEAEHAAHPEKEAA